MVKIILKSVIINVNFICNQIVYADDNFFYILKNTTSNCLFIYFLMRSSKKLERKQRKRISSKNRRHTELNIRLKLFKSGKFFYISSI